ncbi:MAG: hypothetical protein ABIG71_02910, partial [Candidatus Uhrbacteria bacterium]
MGSEKRAPRNTGEQAGAIECAFLALATGDASGAICAQERSGQASFVNSTTLPTDMQGDTRKILEAAGVKFLDPVEGDDMFQYAELPDGWKRQQTDHSMWSNLVDDRGRIRAMIFYKAASYDRSAHMGTCSRFSVGLDYDREHEKSE